MAAAEGRVATLNLDRILLYGSGVGKIERRVGSRRRVVAVVVVVVVAVVVVYLFVCGSFTNTKLTPSEFQKSLFKAVGKDLFLLLLLLLPAMFCNLRTVRNAQTAKKVSGATQKKSRFYVAAAVLLLLLLLLSDKLAWAGAHMGWEPINKKCGAFLCFASNSNKFPFRKQNPPSPSTDVENCRCQCESPSL